MYILLVFSYNLVIFKHNYFIIIKKMYKLLNITFTNWNTYYLIVGVISDQIDIVISKQISLFPKLWEIKKIKSIWIYNGYTEQLTLEHIKLWKTWFQIWKTPEQFSNIEITDNNILLFNSIIQEWKWIILLKSQNYSEKRIEELFPKKEKIILNGNNKMNFKELLSLYYKDRTKSDIIRKWLWEFIKWFYLDTYFEFFKNKDIQIYKDINETYIFRFKEWINIKNKLIKESNNNLKYDDSKLFNDDYVDIIYWDKTIKKKTNTNNITDKFVKKDTYNINQFIQDSKLLSIWYNQKVKYFYTIFIDEQFDVFKKKQDINNFKSDLRDNYKTWWKNYFYSKDINSYEYLLETSKIEDVSKKFKELTLYVPLFHLIKAINKWIKDEEKLKSVLNQYINFLYDKFEFSENTFLKNSIEWNIKQFIKLIKVIILFFEKYNITDIWIIKTRIKEIEKGLKLHYIDCSSDMNNNEINEMYDFLSKNTIVSY